ncbi:Oxidoreductase, short chain dehydrogenase/reductase family [hydrothermal vent metagenome]|uniref:Oxidoreductase, short chain dehydrogenase/reductase family n=1 Tax=hydrothermal vent metagenome TaxID=652676 RepID=A0A1W1BNF8_9ZZZZ
MKNQKIVLITGASSGMGRATTLFLAQKGFMVYAGSRTPSKLLDIESKNIHLLELDITDNKSVKRCIDKIGQIDILVNNAGYGLVSTVEELDEEEMFNQFNVNVFGLLRVSKATIPIMRKQKSGVIINISSFLGKIGLPLLTMYNSSKYAVEGITDSLRYELRDFNIRVHSILPGFFDTQFARSNLVISKKTFDKNSPYAKMVSNLAPNIVEQINNGNSAKEVAQMILKIIEDEKFPARATVGDKASKFIPMRRELSDEDFERRVREYYNL